jgi:zinc protease
VPDPPAGVITKTVKKGQAPQSQVAIVFSGPFDYARLPRHRLRSLEGVLDIRLREELREKRSGVYSTTVQTSVSDKPDDEYQVVVVFGCDPERADELSQAVFEEIEKLKTNSVSADDLAKVKEQQRRERETSLEENSFWLGVLDFYYGQEKEDLLDVLRYTNMIDSLTAEDIQATARQYLDFDNYVKVVLYPEGFEE